ncbi:MAG: biotin synthase BioB [Methyloceanibacter sp.]
MSELQKFPNPIKGKARPAERSSEPEGEARGLRHDWEKAEIVTLLSQPLLDLIDQARAVHRRHHADGNVQLASLLSIKTGACPEDCKYCPQSAYYSKATGLPREQLLDVDEVLAKAALARQAGATRFCMGAAWREVKDGESFDRVLAMVRGVRALKMEACVTLGMLTQAQADRLAQAGLTAYNHNLDTSPEFYGEVITTRRYQDRLDTLERVRRSGVQVCCGGIIGMGESLDDRAGLLQTLANLDPHPESVPINALVAVPGTPLQDRLPIDPLDFVRMVAAARILMPASRVRLSAGRRSLTKEAQLLCFMAGANSIFYGDKLLTTANNDAADDLALIEEAGLQVEPTPLMRPSGPELPAPPLRGSTNTTG